MHVGGTGVVQVSWCMGAKGGPASPMSRSLVNPLLMSVDEASLIYTPSQN